MTTAQSNILVGTHQPKNVDELIDVVRQAHDQHQSLYPIGGGTSLDFGLPMTQPGWGVELSSLDAVVDYPAADMTITVQAGMRMSRLAQILAEHGQQLPLDVPHAAEATVGGVLATNWCGPRRLGYGTPRDYVIGIRAVDGQGKPFAGGGRVVKNVAGYDFCKLLVGSLGTLGIITEVTFKLKPLTPIRRAVVAAPRHRTQLVGLLEQLGNSTTQPVAAEWLLGSRWVSLAESQNWPAAADDVGWLLMLFEGRASEVDWMTQRIQDEWNNSCDLGGRALGSDESDRCLHELSEFPSVGTAAGVKANLRPSHTSTWVEMMLADEPEVSIQAHAANGIVVACFDALPAAGLSHHVVSRWQPAAAAGGGNLVILFNRQGQEMTRCAVWGDASGPIDLMRRIKSAFDPHDILNPQRFIY